MGAHSKVTAIDGGQEAVAPGRLLRFDVLRVACALGVAFYHFEYAAADTLPSVRFEGLSFDVLGSDLHLGTIAVQIFFVLSGLFCAKTVGDRSFSVSGYYKKRLLRLYVPFWISWLLICIWQAYWGGGQFFSTPAIMFPFTVLGLDGFLTSSVPEPHPAGSDLFYLVGEWFLGAMVIVTLLWPLLRLAFRRVGRFVLVALLAIEVLTYLFPDFPPVFVLRYLPIKGMVSYCLGVCLGLGGARVRNSAGLCVAGAALTAAGLVSNRFMPVGLEYLPYHLVSFGVVLLVASFPRVRGLDSAVSEARRRCGYLAVSLSGLTMYYFMFQHVVVRNFVASSTAAAQQGFGTFDYFGLAAIALVATFLVALLADSIEKKLRAMARP